MKLLEWSQLTVEMDSVRKRAEFFARRFGFVCMSLAFSNVFAMELPSFEQVVAEHVSSDALLVDRNGEPLADLRIDPNVRRFQWVRLEELSPAMREALLVAEDKRFYEHSGVDWKAFVGALWHNLWSHTQRGASTLTMQLAGMLDPALRLPRKGLGRRSLEQKWDQSLAAQELEKHWSKSQILEAYLNLAPFRGDIEGIGAAAELLIGKRPADLRREEAAVLAVLLRGPNAKHALVARRACRLIEKLHAGKLCPQIQTLAATRLDAPRNRSRYPWAPHLAQQFLHRGGEHVQLTLDATTQQKLYDLLQKQLDVQGIADADMAMMVMDPTSGEVSAWIGGLNSSRPDGVKLMRPMVGASWPIVYATGIERRMISPASLVQVDSDSWHSIRYALAAQLPMAVKQVQAQIGYEPTLNRLQALGLDGVFRYGVIDMLDEVSLLQIVQSWRALAMDGQWLPAFVKFDREIKARRIFSAETAFMLRRMLADRSIYPDAISNMLDAIPTWSIHSADDRDAIMVGGTPRLVFGLAIALPKDAPIGAARKAFEVWREGAKTLGLKAEPMRPPNGVVNTLVVFEPPIEAPRKEWFLKGTETSLMTIDATTIQAPRIVYPANGLYQVEADPAQRLLWPLSAEGVVRGRWRLDGQLIGEGPRVRWLPEAGVHLLELLNQYDELLDRVQFEVVLQNAEDRPVSNAPAAAE